MKDGKYYKFVELPQLPKELESLCAFYASNDKNLIYSLNKQIYNTKEELDRKPCLFDVYDIPQEVRKWLYDNKIIKNINQKNVGIQKSYNGNSIYPHIDKMVDSNEQIRFRNYALNYLLSESGPITNFYKDNLDIIEGVIVPSRSWHILNVKVLHGVENIKNERLTLSVTLE